jgi:6-pyruvoyl-tetrahydropterin synthase
MALAARKSWQETAEIWREKIRISQIVNRLQDFVEAQLTPKGFVLLPIKPTKEMLAIVPEDQYKALLEASPKDKKVEMSPSQVKAAQVLLDRVMPTLSASEITHKKETISPEELIRTMRDRYGDEFADRLVKDYLPKPQETLNLKQEQYQRVNGND